MYTDKDKIVICTAIFVYYYTDEMKLLIIIAANNYFLNSNEIFFLRI